MGGVVDGGAGIGFKTSPRRAAIEKAQAALRQEYDVREERRRELEFLEKGGNPLDFKFGTAACTSVQSTSVTDRHPEQFVTSDAKGSFALNASPHGDSVESSGRPGTRTVCEPNSADNLLLFDGEHELLERKKNSMRPGKRNNTAPSKQSSQRDGSQNARESEDSTIFRPYARRNRSKSIRDGARSNSNDIVQSRAGHGPLVSHGESRDSKGGICETNKQKDQKATSLSNGDLVSKTATSDKQLDGMQGVVVSTGLGKGSLPENKLDVGALKDVLDNQRSLPAQIDDQQPPPGAGSERDHREAKEQILSTAIEGQPCAATTISDNEAGSCPENGLSILKVDRKSIPKDVQNTSTAAFGMKGLDSESSCTQMNLCLDVNNDSDVCTNKRNVGSNGNATEQKSKSEGSPNVVGGDFFKETNEIKIDGGGANVGGDLGSICQNHTGNGSVVKVEEEIHLRVSGEQNQEKCTPSNMEGLENNVHSILENDKSEGNDSIVNKENFLAGGSRRSVDALAHDLPATALLEKDSASVLDHQTSDNSLKLVNKAHEDSVLEEARMIEAKRKRIAELSVCTLPSENRRKSHWEFVLEEMAWLANDFAQERLWKITAAAQMSRVVASASRLRFEEQNHYWKVKKVAHTLANAVRQFWLSAEMHLSGDMPSVDLENSKYDMTGSRCTGGSDSEDKFEKPVTKTIKAPEHSPGKSLPLAVQGYAVRFLKSTSVSIPPFQAEAAATSEDITDMGISEMSWEDHLTEEVLFYTVPSGAMEAYRRSVESHLVQCENTCSSMQEEVDTHMYDAIAEYGYQESTYDDDEGETGTYYLPGAFEGSKSSKIAQKKRKHLVKSYSARSCEMPTNVPHGHFTTGAQRSMPMGKRPATNLNVGAIPTKRMRTATRQRVLTPFGAGGTGGVQVPAKTEASSGDTSSFQDDQSTLHGGSQIQKSVEVESAADFEKQMRYDSAEMSTKPKKKKKPKHLGTAYDQGWQLDSTVKTEQRDLFKSRADNHHFESNGTSGLYGQHSAKRPKIAKHPLDNTFDNITPMTGSIPSPAASMSNMSNPNKFIKLMGGRDRGRKAKGVKISAGQSGSGSPWTLFEDQALVVLVHDMGPNWELVSDAVNSTLQFKCIFRKPRECKERHKMLMDRSASDGADSAEDSGSSQSYPSTLPGIPKGSARQLFQCLQGPMVEDTLKSHFEKIIIIGQKQHYRRSQNNNEDSKQIAPVHNSHVIALSQVFPNNLSGSILTPLDLCDTTPSSPDVLPLGYQGSHAGGLTMSNQGAVASILATSGPNSSLQGSPGMALGSNLQSPTGPISASVRDGRFGVPRTPIPDEQRMQQYNQMLSSGRNIQQSNLSVPGPRINGMGMMSGMNRPLPVARPGFQGMTPSPMLNSGSMLGIPSSAIHSGQGNSMLRPREALHMMRPGHNSEHQRPAIVQEQMSQGVTPFNGLSAAFSNPTTTPPVQTYTGHQMAVQQPHVLSNPHHAAGSPQQAYAMRVAKERQQQQRYIQQQQSNSLMPLAQHPIPSSLPNNINPQIHLQSTSQPVSGPSLTPSSPMTAIASQHQQKHHLQSGLGRNPNTGLTNQMAKQQRRQTPQQHFQQSGRHHLQHRQHGQQQAKVLKGIGRGNQNISVEPSHPNGITVAAASQSGEQMIHPMQSQSSYSGSGLNSVPPSKPLVSSQSSTQSQLQQKLYPSQTPTKPPHQIPSDSENSTQGQVPQLASGNTFPVSHQAVASAGVASNHSQLQQPPHQTPANQIQPVVHGVHQQNSQVRPDPPSKGPVNLVQDQQFVNNASQIGATSVMLQTCTDSANAVPIASQWKAADSVSDSGMPSIATKVDCIESPTLPPRGDPVSNVSQGSGQRQLSGNIPSHEHNTVTQRHQQPQSEQSVVSLPHSTQQHDHQIEQLSPTLQKERQLD